jgi:deazaflavin-dependent oxidoreductase (nitroreductase family)
MASDPELSDWLRHAFRPLNGFMVAMWRLGLGRWVNIWPEVFGRIMIIRHVGRRTKLLRLTPVNFAFHQGELYCTAGYGAGSDWYRNIVDEPVVEVWLPDGWWMAVVEDVSDRSDRLDRMRQVLIASGIVAPLFGIYPATGTDEELNRQTGDYRLLRVRLIEPRTGSGGPGDLAWLWPAATLALTLVLSLRRRHR